MPICHPLPLHPFHVSSAIPSHFLPPNGISCPFSPRFLLSFHPPFSGGRLGRVLGQLFLLLCSPPLSILYLCCLYNTLLASNTSPSSDIGAVLVGGVGVAGRGLVLAYNSWYFAEAWLFPVGCVVVWPAWLMGWKLACQTVQEEEEKESGRGGGKTDSSASHLHSD